jgi:hypothetical protein
LIHFDGWAYSGARPEDLEWLRKDKYFRHLISQQDDVRRNLYYVYAFIEEKARELYELICEKKEIC